MATPSKLPSPKMAHDDGLFRDLPDPYVTKKKPILGGLFQRSKSNPASLPRRQHATASAASGIDRRALLAKSKSGKFSMIAPSRPSLLSSNKSQSERSLHASSTNNSTRKSRSSRIRQSSSRNLASTWQNDSASSASSFGPQSDSSSSPVELLWQNDSSRSLTEDLY